MEFVALSRMQMIRNVRQMHRHKYASPEANAEPLMISANARHPALVMVIVRLRVPTEANVRTKFVLATIVNRTVTALRNVEQLSGFAATRTGWGGEFAITP